MTWPIYSQSGTRPTAANHAGNVGLYASGAQTHGYGTRLWVTTNPSLLTPSAFSASFTHLTQLRKADWQPADHDSRDLSHLLSPYRVKERRASWGNPGSYDLEFNYTAALMERQAALTPSPAVADDNHRYVIVEDPDGSVHQLYGFFQPPSKQAGVEQNENVIGQKFESCGIDTFVKSA